MNHEQKLKQALQELDALKGKIEGLISSDDKFYELKKAYSNGETIQSRKNGGKWFDISGIFKPNWYEDQEYRIKPDTSLLNIDKDIQKLRSKYPQYRFTIHVEDNV